MSKAKIPQSFAAANIQAAKILRAEESVVRAAMRWYRAFERGIDCSYEEWLVLGPKARAAKDALERACARLAALRAKGKGER